MRSEPQTAAMLVSGSSVELSFTQLADLRQLFRRM